MMRAMRGQNIAIPFCTRVWPVGEKTGEKGRLHAFCGLGEEIFRPFLLYRALSEAWHGRCGIVEDVVFH